MTYTFTILGSGSSTGVPIPGCDCQVCLSDDPLNSRLRSSAVLRNDKGLTILFDTSPDLRNQALKNKISQVDAVIFTHAHADHILGFDDMRSFNFRNPSPIPCYGTPDTFKGIKESFGYIFRPNPRYKGGLLTTISENTIEAYKPFSIAGIKFLPFLLDHGGIEVMGFRIGDLAYATDCKIIPQRSFDAIKGVKTLIIDGLRHEPHATHMTIDEAIAAAKSLNAEKTYLTHINHAVDHKTTQAQLPKGIELAYDGLEIKCSI